MGKGINNNGYDYVDLGLPSGTLWATCNVGASNPSDFGLYFQWGNTKGYSEEQIGIGNGQKKFFWPDYKWNPSGDSYTFTKYATKGETLELEDDAANVNMGGDWHMPTPEQINELINNTTRKWTALDGVSGRLFTSKTNTSQSIFIPAAGYAWDGSVRSSGDGGGVWSSMLDAGYADGGQSLCFDSGFVVLDYYYRCGGLSVRGVIG